MKVSRWYSNKEIKIEEVPTPEPGPREILVKILSCGICGSDIVEWYRLPRAPLVQGHEIGGQIVEVGRSVQKYKPGDRVFVAPKVPCMECYYCKNGHYPVCSNVKERLPGGLAQYVLVPEALAENGTYLLPAHVSYDQSTFIEPLACVVRSQNLGGVRPDQTLAVLGSGMSGLLQIRLAKAKGCKVIASDIDSKRLEFAEKSGADLTIDAKDDVAERLVAENKKKADVVFLCTSALPAIEQAWRCVDKGGVIVFFAVPGPDKTIAFPINSFWREEVQILTSYYCGPPDIVDAIELIRTGEIEIDDLITHTLPLRDVAKGFQLVMDGRESIKVIIRPNE